MTIERSILTLALLGALASCGGGNEEEAGSPTKLSVQPDKLEIKSGSPGQCYKGPAGTFFVYGGVAPYRLDNPQPDMVALSTLKVSEPGGSFSVEYTTFGCFNPGHIIIVDALGNQVTLEIKSIKGDATTP